MRRVLIVVAALATGLVVLAPAPAPADCGGPQIQVVPAAGEPGAAFTVYGDDFGTECYDTGPPPPGVGYAGPPAQDIEVSITDASFTRTVLGTVDADDRYHFRLDVDVPAGAATGEASVQASGDQVFFVVSSPFTVTGPATVVPATPAFTG